MLLAGATLPLPAELVEALGGMDVCAAVEGLWAEGELVAVVGLYTSM